MKKGMSLAELLVTLAVIGTGITLFFYLSGSVKKSFALFNKNNETENTLIFLDKLFTEKTSYADSISIIEDTLKIYNGPVVSEIIFEKKNLKYKNLKFGTADSIYINKDLDYGTEVNIVKDLKTYTLYVSMFNKIKKENRQVFYEW